MALHAKDRQIAMLTAQIAPTEAQRREFFDALVSCINGDGFVMYIGRLSSVSVKRCEIEHEWVDGKFYYGLNGRRPRKENK